MKTNEPKAQLMHKVDILTNGRQFSTQLTNFSNNQYHYHNFYEIFYVLEGKARQVLNNETLVISTGDLFILRSDKDAHSFFGYNSEIFIHRDIMIEKDLVKETADFLSPDLFDELENARMPFHLNLSTEALKELEAKFQQQNGRLDEKSNLALAKKILIDILMFAVLDAPNINEQMPIWMNTLISILDHSTHLTLPEVLQDFNYSQAYICRTFKKYMGITMTEYFNEIKLNKAHMLLKTTDIPINELLDIIGFENKTHFYRCFKKKYKKTPKEARFDAALSKMKD